MKDMLNEWCSQLSKPLILLVDENDSLYDDVLISVLRQFGDGCQFRQKGFPLSVTLVGLRDVREYKEKVRDIDKSIGSGSLFNIKAKLLTIRNFSRSQIAELMQKYKDEGGQSFSDGIIDLFYAGQRFVIELKIRFDSYSLEDGKDQITRYLDKLGLNHGYLMLFRNSKFKYYSLGTTHKMDRS